MSLTDTDKTGDSRSNPTLNAQDGLPPDSVMAHATTGISYRAEGTTNTAKVINKDDQIVLFDGVANKILIGRDGSGNWDVKIAEDGVNVLTATDAQLLFSGARNTLQVRGGVYTTTITGGSYSPGSYDSTATVDLSDLNLTATPLIFAYRGSQGLGGNPWGGNTIDFIDASAPAKLRAFSVYQTSHTSTQASFTYRFINCSAGETLTVGNITVTFIVCTQSAS